MAERGETPPTLEEVGELAGVSRATVSRVINNSPRVSSAARESVERAIAKLGYTPSQAARSLVTRRTDAVALVVAEPEARFFSDPFFSGVVRGVGRVACRAGRSVRPEAMGGCRAKIAGPSVTGVRRAGKGAGRAATGAHGPAPEPRARAAGSPHRRSPRHPLDWCPQGRPCRRHRPGPRCDPPGSFALPCAPIPVAGHAC